MQMVSMKTDEDSEVAPATYDCCPCIYLNDDQVEALGIKGMPLPGTVFMIQARAVVTSVSAHAEEADEVATEGTEPDVSLSLKITDMGLTPAKTSDTERATLLYGGE